ncbi:MAG TPA: hypothetical protein VH392_11490 [Sphingomicrobium sp.]|jgi:hypothetical protein
MRSIRGRVLLAGGFGASALLAIAAVTLFPSVTPSSRAVAASVPLPPAKSLRVEAEQKGIPPATIEDPAIRRFTGRVGPNLTQSLAAAGVPERQGREYVWLLGKAVPLAEGLSVDDRFDLVVQRNPDGTYGQLLYAGMDRIARADVELMK